MLPSDPGRHGQLQGAVEPPPPLSSFPSTVLRLGSSGPAVKALQLQLNKLGERLLASGQFGPRTMEAVRRFQVIKGLNPATGIVDASTRKVLDELHQTGNPRVMPRQRRPADWFESSAQTVVDSDKAPPESVMLALIDGRSLTVEQGVATLKEAFARVRGGVPRDPDDERDLVTGEVVGEYEKLSAKGHLTASERKQLGRSLKRAYEVLGEADLIDIGGDAPKPAVRVLE